MRADQITKLSSLSSDLTDVVLGEADPTSWPGDGKKLVELTQDERGDRYWSKKNAAATLSLLIKIHTMLGIADRGLNQVMPEDDDMDAEIAKAEKAAKKILGKFRAPYVGTA